MATKMDDMQRSLEDLEKEVTCAVCLEHYTEPKVLPSTITTGQWTHCSCKEALYGQRILAVM